MYIENVYNYQAERFRAYQLKKHDRFYVSRDKYKLKLGEYIQNTSCMCVRLIKRDKWWQFWKPRYKGAIYQVMEDWNMNFKRG